MMSKQTTKVSEQGNAGPRLAPQGLCRGKIPRPSVRFGEALAMMLALKS